MLINSIWLDVSLVLGNGFAPKKNGKKKKEINGRIFKNIFIRHNDFTIYMKSLITFYIQTVVTYACHFSSAGKLSRKLNFKINCFQI